MICVERVRDFTKVLSLALPERGHRPVRVMAGLVPAIHVFDTMTKQDVDARDKPGHDEKSENRPQLTMR